MLLMARQEDGVDQFDVLVCSVRLTKDGVPICTNESITGSDELHVKTRTLAELQARVGHVVCLKDTLDKHFNSILINIQLKGAGTARAVVNLLKERYIKRPDDWGSCMLSSFRVKELYRARRAAPSIPLALLQRKNPFAFIAHYRTLKLAAVGFHRLYVSSFALSIAERIGVLRFVYTVNRPSAAARYDANQFDAIVSDMPEKLQSLRD